MEFKSEYSLKSMIIETNQLYDLINSKENIKVLDCSFFLPTDVRKSKEEFLKERIPGSVFFDIDEIADKSTNLPHMILTNETEFIEHMKILDIRNDIIKENQQLDPKKIEIMYLINVKYNLNFGLGNTQVLYLFTPFLLAKASTCKAARIYCKSIPH